MSFLETINGPYASLGSDRVTRKFDTQKEAIKVAREFARNQGTELYIHGEMAVFVNVIPTEMIHIHHQDD